MTAFKPMLAKDGDLSKIAWPQYAQPKLDGIRASVVDGKLVSRTLKPIPNAEIREALERPEFEGFDGELIVGEPTAEDCYRRTASFVMAPNKTGEPWAFHAFDLWNDTRPYSLRKIALDGKIERTTWTGTPIFGVLTLPVHDAGELEELEVKWLAEGMEGVILRDPAALYKFGRSGKTGPLLKVKRFIDFEAEVIGVYEQMHNANEAVTNALGRTERSTKQEGLRPTGLLGGLILRGINGPAEGVEFRCGTGFDATQRAALWAYATDDDGEADETPLDSPGPLRGWVAKVKSFPIGVKDKPRHPVFLGWRDVSVDG